MHRLHSQLNILLSVFVNTVHSFFFLRQWKTEKGVVKENMEILRSIAEVWNFCLLKSIFTWSIGV